MFEQIEVFGENDKRMWSEGLDKFGRNKLRGDQSWLKKNEPKLYKMELVKGMDKAPKRHFINKGSCPVRNPYSNIDGITRSEGIRMFDSYLWNQWHEDGQMPEQAKFWFWSRVKEYKKGNNIDLVCNCRKFRGNGNEKDPHLSKYPCDCHGYSLKKYIEFLAKESND